MKNIVFTGGSGMLGTAMKSHFQDSHFPTRRELDLQSYGSIEYYFAGIPQGHVNTFVHLAAETDTKACETTDHGAIRAIESNIMATAHITTYCIINNIRLVYMSSDYVYGEEDGYNREDHGVNPCNKYAWSKLGGEASVALCDNHTIVRGSFGEDIFPYPKAYTNRYTSKLPVTEFAKRLAKVITIGNGIETINIGSKPQSVYEYAKKNRPSVEPDVYDDIVTGAYKIPRDTSLNCAHYDEIFGSEDE
jgi:dTDP-4-dehydrorhamnose reductase